MTKPDPTLAVMPATWEPIMRAVFRSLGECDPNRDGLADTPRRIAKAWLEMTAGYAEDPEQILSTTFAVPHDEVIVVRDVPFWSLCEHHLLPFHGVAHVAYLPGDRIVGLSKIPRLVRCFARRLQVQERLTDEIAVTLMDTLDARGAAAILRATHTCMAARGVGVEGQMVTSSLQGEFRNPALRSEFMALVGGDAR